MKKSLVVLMVLFISTIFPQNKVKYFLNSPENYKKLPKEVLNKVSPELFKMHKEWSEELGLENLHEVYTTERVATGQYFDENTYNALRSGLTFPTAAEIYAIKQLSTRYTYANDAKYEDRTLEVNKTVFKNYPKWNSVVEHYGGFSEIAKAGVTKSKHQNGNYGVTGKLYEIGMSKDNVAYAKILLTGNLKYHDIGKDEIRYDGTYSADKTDFTNIYRYEKNQPKVYFSFPEKKYMKKTNVSYTFAEIIGKKEYNEISYRYAEALVLMIDAYISDDVFWEIDEIKEIRLEEKAIQLRNIKISQEKFRRDAEFAKEEAEKRKVERNAKYHHNNQYNFGYWYISKGTFPNDIKIEDIDISQVDEHAIGLGVLLLDIAMVDIHLSWRNYEMLDELVVVTSSGIGYYSEPYSEIVIPSPKLNVIGVNFEVGYDVLSAQFPVRPFVGLGWGAYHTSLKGVEWEDINNDFFDTQSVYGFVELMTKRFEKPKFFVSVRGTVDYNYDSSYPHDGRTFTGVSLKIGR